MLYFYMQNRKCTEKEVITELLLEKHAAIRLIQSYCSMLSYFKLLIMCYAYYINLYEEINKTAECVNFRFMYPQFL